MEEMVVLSPKNCSWVRSNISVKISTKPQTLKILKNLKSQLSFFGFKTLTKNHLQNQIQPQNLNQTSASHFGPNFLCHWSLPYSSTRVTSFKSHKQESVSQVVTDRSRQWSDLRLIKTTTRPHFGKPMFMLQIENYVNTHISRCLFPIFWHLRNIDAFLMTVI